MIDYFEDMLDDGEYVPGVHTESSEGSHVEKTDEIESFKSLEDDFFGEDKKLSYVEEVLKSRGIDPNAIKFQNEDGEIEETSFEDLNDDEKRDLLLIDPDKDNFEEDMGLETEEIELLNYLRENNLTTEEFVNLIKEQTRQELASPEATYTVDDFNDDELFIADFRNKYGEDFTDEELLSELEKAKENDALFQKKINKVRDEYKTYEIETAKQTQANEKSAKEQTEQEYINSVVSVASRLNEMHDTVELEDSDKEDILAFMFDKNAAGQSEYTKALNNPEINYKAAWYVKHGDQVIRDIHNYYQQEIAKLSKEVKRSSTPQAVLKDNSQTRTRTTPKSKDHLENFFDN